MPVMTMPLSNKALQMDPHASRLVGSVTDTYGSFQFHLKKKKKLLITT